MESPLIFYDLFGRDNSTALFLPFLHGLRYLKIRDRILYKIFRWFVPEAVFNYNKINYYNMHFRANVENFDTEITQRNRVSTSSDLYSERRKDIKEENVEARRSQFNRQRSHSYDTSNFKPENKTKIFQIGIDRLTIIDTDSPGVLDVKFSRVSRCVQGVRHPKCFGFVAREPKRNSRNVQNGPEFCFHVFQCFDEQTVNILLE